MKLNLKFKVENSNQSCLGCSFTGMWVKFFQLSKHGGLQMAADRNLDMPKFDCLIMVIK